MNDADTRLQEIKDRVLAFAKEREWEQFHSPKNLSMAISAEAAELMEHFLWQSPEQSHADVEAIKLRAKVEEELADVFIFAIEFANVTGIDIAAIVEAISIADARFGVGSEKLEFVRTKAVSYLQGQAGWIIDTIIPEASAAVR